MLKEPEIKLFGRKIYFPDNGAAAAGGEHSVDSSNECSNGSVDCDRSSEVSRGQEREGLRERGDGEEKLEQRDEDQETGELCETTPENQDESQNANTSSDSNENPKTPSNNDDNQPKLENEQQNGHQKTLKKPDKILPCPRCNSMDTKFCYYNNYNVNQPRHFCKSCQRYWTAGGTMRNVPVGAGRRKNKNLTPNYHHIEALQSERINTTSGFQGLKFNPNGTVLSFGEPMSSGLNLDEKKASNGVRNGYYKIDQKIPSPIPIPGVQYSFPWNSAVICPPGYTFPYYPSPVWGNAWNVPSPTSTLGKHSRNGDLINPNRPQESSIVVPKTLRIDDPDEAAKSSIWSTLGIKYSREGLFKALQSKAADKKSVLNKSSPLLQANPAALSRSMNFQERA